MKIISFIALLIITNICHAEFDNYTFSITLQGINYTNTVENTNDSIYDINNKKLHNGEAK